MVTLKKLEEDKSYGDSIFLVIRWSYEDIYNTLVEIVDDDIDKYTVQDIYDISDYIYNQLNTQSESKGFEIIRFGIESWLFDKKYYSIDGD